MKSIIKFLKSGAGFIGKPTHVRTILVLLILVAAIPLTVFVSQQQQNLRQRADCNEYDTSTCGTNPSPVPTLASVPPTQPAASAPTPAPPIPTPNCTLPGPNPPPGQPNHCTCEQTCRSTPGDPTNCLNICKNQGFPILTPFPTPTPLPTPIPFCPAQSTGICGACITASGCGSGVQPCRFQYITETNCRKYTTDTLNFHCNITCPTAVPTATPIPSPTPTLAATPITCISITDVNSLARRYRQGDTAVTLQAVNIKARQFRQNPCP